MQLQSHTWLCQAWLAEQHWCSQDAQCLCIASVTTLQVRSRIVREAKAHRCSCSHTQSCVKLGLQSSTGALSMHSVLCIASVTTLLICFIHPFIQSLIWSLVDSFNHSFIHSFLHASIHSFLHSSIHSFFHSFNHLSVHSCVRLIVCWDSTFPQHLMHEAISIPCMRRSCLPDSCSLMSPCNSTTPWQSQAHSQQAINCVPPLCSFFTHALGCRVLPWFCTVKIRPITNLLGSSCPVESAVSCDGQSVILTSMLV